MIADPKHIAIIKPSALGDIVHALPVLGAVRQRYPEARITWVVNRAFEPLLAGHPDLTATLPFDRGAFRRGIWDAARYMWEWTNTLRGQRFDLVLDLQGLLRTGIMTAATGAAIKIGFANAREGATRFYTHHVHVPNPEHEHAVDRYWRVAEFLGAGGWPKRWFVPESPVETAAVRAEFAHLPWPRVAVAVGAKWTTKRWPPAQFAELLRRVGDRFGGSIVLVGSADDIQLSAAVASAISPAVAVHDLTGRTSLPKLVAVLAAADLMVANDTGPLHLAAALGVPCVAPYLCTKTVKHGPYAARPGVTATGIETRVPCAGSYLKRCPTQTECFAELTPDRLWPAVAEVLETCRASRSA